VSRSLRRAAPSRRRRTALCVVLAAFGASLVQVGPVRAAWGCAANAFCAFIGENGGGSGPFTWWESNTNWHAWAIADDDDSWSNMNATYNVRVFTNTGFVGPCQIRINKGTSKGSSLPWENDDGSSHKRDSQTVAC
jgi:hypothetical protein